MTYKPGSLMYRREDGEEVIAQPGDVLFTMVTMVATHVWHTNKWTPVDDLGIEGVGTLPSYASELAIGYDEIQKQEDEDYQEKLVGLAEKFANNPRGLIYEGPPVVIHNSQAVVPKVLSTRPYGGEIILSFENTPDEFSFEETLLYDKDGKRIARIDHSTDPLVAAPPVTHVVIGNDGGHRLWKDMGLDDNETLKARLSALGISESIIDPNAGLADSPAAINDALRREFRNYRDSVYLAHHVRRCHLDSVYHAQNIKQWNKRKKQRRQRTGRRK